MKKIISICLVIIIVSCKDQSRESANKDAILNPIGLNKEELYNKVLGNLVGSAMGDAMGAPTEMWSREAIKLEYGEVQDLDSMVRYPSPEGTWVNNLPAGGTTDDTRWKKLAMEYLIENKSLDLKAEGFANKILKNYTESKAKFKTTEDFKPEPYENIILEMSWLQEWAKVAKPYTENKMHEYNDAMNKFYGGEMVCAGLLFAPSIGAFYPNNPEKAYNEMYNINIYDQGYARDISSLAAAMTAASMSKNPSQNNVLATLRLDPKDYFSSRLVGRSSYNILRTALQIVKSAKASKDPRAEAFKQLDARQQDFPFHAGEIYLQVMTAMLYADFDYLKTMQFLVNYGRDNDTTAAIAGGILGAYTGYNALPADKIRVMQVCKQKLNIDLELLAKNMTEIIWELEGG